MNETKVKISKSMVKMVTLLLLQPRVYGVHENGSNESYNPEELDNQKVGGYGWMEPLHLHDHGVRLWNVH